MQTVHRLIKSEKELDTLIAYCKETGYASIDFETNGEHVWSPNFYPTVLGVSFQPGSGWIIPLAHKDSIFKPKWEKVFKKFATEILTNPSIIKIAWNLEFEYSICLKYGYRMRGRIFDAMMAKYLLDETRPNGLKEMVDRFLPEFSGYDLPGAPSGKAKRQTIINFWSNVEINSLSKYCAGDSDFTFRLFIYFEDQLIKQNLYRLFRSMYMPLVRILAKNRLRGIRIDREYLEFLDKKFSQDIEQLEKDLRSIPIVADYEEHLVESRVQAKIEELEDEIAYGTLSDRQIANKEEKISNLEAGIASTKKEESLFEPLNFGSPKQLGELLFESSEGFNFPIIERTESGAPSTAEDTLIQLKAYDDSGFIDKLLELRGETKTYSTYVKNILEEQLTDDNRLHPGFIPTATVCVGENTKIITNQGILRIGDLVPKTIGEAPIKGLEVLTHRCRFRPVSLMINKGYQEMWRIVTESGDYLECTPGHLLMSEEGWQPVEKIIENRWLVASFNGPKLEPIPITHKPEKEEIRPILGFEGYFVSNCGDVYTQKKRGNQGGLDIGLRLMKPRVINGYRKVILYDEGVRFQENVSRIVWVTFKGPIPKGLVIDHIDCNTIEDHINNLQCITHSENTRRSYRFNYPGNLGERHVLHTLSIDQVLKMFSLNNRGYSNRYIASFMGVSNAHLSIIIKRDLWSWVKPTTISLEGNLGKRLVCDMQVEDDHSYITQSGFINHNTGRLGSRNPNYQNIPRITSNPYIKRYTLPDRPGQVIAEVDASQAELRTIASIADDKPMKEIFRSGKNIHVATAAKITGADYDLINKARKDESHPDHIWAVKEHKKAKVTNFGIIYGMSGYKLSDQLTVDTGHKHSVQEADEIIEDWFKAFPGVKRHIKTTHKLAQQTGKVVSPIGRVRRLPILLNTRNKMFAKGEWNEALRQSVNGPVQGFASDITQWANINIYEATLKGELPEYILMYITVHDSLEYSIYIDDVPVVVPQIMEIAGSMKDMEKYFGGCLKGVDMKFSGEVGITWGHAHEFDPKVNYKELFEKDIEEYNKHRIENNVKPFNYEQDL